MRNTSATILQIIAGAAILAGLLTLTLWLVFVGVVLAIVAEMLRTDRRNE